MKGFRFSLQALLTLRQRQERASLERYARALGAQQQSRERLARSHHAAAEAWSSYEQTLRAGSPAAEVLQLRGHCGFLDQERQRHQALAETDARATVQARGDMLAARQAREMVDRHRTHQRAAHHKALNEAEQKMLDDLVNRRLVPLASTSADTLISTP